MESRTRLMRGTAEELVLIRTSTMTLSHPTDPVLVFRVESGTRVSTSQRNSSLSDVNLESDGRDRKCQLDAARCCFHLFDCLTNARIVKDPVRPAANENEQSESATSND